MLEFIRNISFKEILRNLKRIQFRGKESRNFFIAVILLGVMFSFRSWGADNFDASVGIGNLIIAIALSLAAVYIHEMAHRYHALKRGFECNYYTLLPTLVGFVLAVASNGRLVIPLLSALRIDIALYGKYRRTLDPKALARGTMLGVMASLLVGLLSKWLFFATGFGIFSQFARINLLIAAWNLLPLPTLDGLNILYENKLKFLFFAIFAIASAIMINVFGLIGTIIVSALIAGGAALGLYVYFWKNPF